VPDRLLVGRLEIMDVHIAARTFERSFELAYYVKVKGASLENGLLHVDLVREIREAMKPRAIPITRSSIVSSLPRPIESPSLANYAGTSIQGSPVGRSRSR
jgi:hypothetical protein